MDPELQAFASDAPAEMNYGADTSDCRMECVPNLIRKRAFQLFEAKGRQSGHELDDWLQAEREIKHHLLP
jgi:hypothetical protein